MKDKSSTKESMIGHHGWLWFSISLLVLGQVTSLIYLLQSQQSLLDNFKCSCPSTEEDLFMSSTTNSSISQQDHLAVAQSLMTSDDQQHHQTLSRKKRSTSKPPKHNKVYRQVLMVWNQMFYQMFCCHRKMAVKSVRTNTIRQQLRHYWDLRPV